MRVTDRDHGAAALTKRLSGMRRGTVSVGIHTAEGNAQAIGLPGEAAPGLTVAALAEFHEFGLGVPPRSFIRGPIDEREAELRSKFLGAAQEGARTGQTVEKALARFGLYVVGQLQLTLADGGSYVGLAPSTEASRERRGMSSPYVPLIVTGQLRSSIRSKVTL